MANKKISELPVGTTATSGTKFEALQGGINVQVDADDLPGTGITREFNRTFVETLVFDKHEIFHAGIVMDSDILLEIAPGGLVDQASSMRFRITADGIHSVSFGTGFDFKYGITSGQVLDAGTYEFYFLYTNGSVVVVVPGVTAQASGAVTLAAPSNFAAVADGENAIDLSWTNVASNEGYLIEYSLDGITSWATLETTAVDAVTSTQTGLTEGSERFYQITTLGNGTTTLNSTYSTASATTVDASDVTPPTFTFSPVDTATDVGVSDPIVITASEPVMDSDGVTVITNSNAADYITLKETNGAGADIAKTVTIDATKTIFTITPTSGYGGNQLVFVEIGGVNDLNGNTATPDNITFTTSAYTTFNGTSNNLRFGDIMDGVWALNDVQFKLKVTIQNMPLVGDKSLFTKWSGSDNQRSWAWTVVDDSVQFIWCRVGTSVSRVIRWTGVILDTLEHDLEVRYNGSIDTNDGLDRCSLYIDGVLQGSKTLVSSVGVLTGVILNTSAQLCFGAYVSGAGVAVGAYFSGDAKDLQVLSGAGDTNELQVAVLFEGTDSSGNARDGTWA
jgi:hypothetical protein